MQRASAVKIEFLLKLVLLEEMGRESHSRNNTMCPIFPAHGVSLA